MFLLQICLLSNPYMFLLSTIITWPDLFLYLYGNMENREYSYYLSGCLVTKTRLTAKKIYNWRPKKSIIRKGEIQLLLREGQAYLWPPSIFQDILKLEERGIEFTDYFTFPIFTSIFFLLYNSTLLHFTSIPLDRLRILVAHRALIIPPSTKDE